VVTEVSEKSPRYLENGSCKNEQVMRKNEEGGFIKILE
jgi:hypothetical protein